MLFWLAELSDGGGVFNLFRYITFRAGAAFFTALIFGFIFGRPLINLLRRRQGNGQPIRDDGPAGHMAKAGTPTMGGALILGALTVATLLCARLDNPYVWIVLLVTVAFGLVGFADDYAKVKKGNSKGVSGRTRFGIGLAIAAAAGIAAALAHPPDLTNQLAVPVFKSVLINMGWFFVPFAMIVIVGLGQCGEPDRRAGRAGDHAGDDRRRRAGRDRLCRGAGRFHHLSGRAFRPRHGRIADLLRGPDRRRPGLSVVQRAPRGGVHGRYRLARLGGALGAIAVCTKHEIVLAIVGGLFVVEALSVIIQVLYFKRTGKRVFLMAPIHHHFEKKGWAEPQIVIRFWIISLILALIGLATLKVR
jgi:phospho-N-acetylmuramoyl-pentapeptide-transferase